MIKRGGILADEADRQLLKQFCRGCWDDMLIANLRLEHKSKTPSFPELLLQLRSEENKYFTKESRMKQHLGVQRQRASSHVVTANPLDQNHNEVSEHTEVAELKKQITKLQGQLAKQKSKTTRQSELPSNDAVLELKQQVTELQSQMTKLRIQKNPESKSNSIQFNSVDRSKQTHKFAKTLLQLTIGNLTGLSQAIAFDVVRIDMLLQFVKMIQTHPL